MRFISHLLFIIVCVFWGSSFMLMWDGLAVTTPVGVAVARTATGALALAALWLARRAPWPLRRRDLPAMLFVTVAGYALPFVLQVHVISAVQAHSGHGSSFMGMMVALLPLLTILVSVPMLGVRPTARQVLGVIGGLAAMLLLFADELHKGVTLADLALASVIPVCYAVVNTFVKRRFNHVPATALVVTALSMCALMLTPLAILEGPVKPSVFDEATWRGIAALLVLGTLCTGVGTFFCYLLLQREGPLFVSMVTYIIPTVALLWGWTRGETISKVQLGTLAVIFAMVALTQWGGAKRIVEMEPP